MFYVWHGLAIVLLAALSFAGGYYGALFRESISTTKRENQ